MPNRLWMFNPGCQPEPCCGDEEPAPVCPVTITVDECLSGRRSSGATVKIKSGVTTLDTKVTNSSGVAIVDIGAAGTYTVEVTKPDYATNTSSHLLACNGTLTRVLAAGAGWTCACSGISMCDGNDVRLLPSVLYLSDGTDTVACTYGNGGFGGWRGCVTRQLMGRTNCAGYSLVTVVLLFDIYCIVTGEWSADVRYDLCSGDNIPNGGGSCVSWPSSTNAENVGLAYTDCDPVSITWPAKTLTVGTASHSIWGGSLTLTASE